jgi:hypothetical protein
MFRWYSNKPGKRSKPWILIAHRLHYDPPFSFEWDSDGQVLATEPQHLCLSTAQFLIVEHQTFGRLTLSIARLNILTLEIGRNENDGEDWSENQALDAEDEGLYSRETNIGNSNVDKLQYHRVVHVRYLRME